VLINKARDGVGGGQEAVLTLAGYMIEQNMIWQTKLAAVSDPIAACLAKKACVPQKALSLTR
jgi:hypothetical protein